MNYTKKKNFICLYFYICVCVCGGIFYSYNVATDGYILYVKYEG